MTIGWLYPIVGLVVIQRLLELILARRNTQRLLAQGAAEHGAGHYPFLVLLHVAWLVALVLLVSPTTAPNLPLLALFAVLQIGRVWVIVSLGPFWTTRVISVPNAPLVRRGPYRFLRHPNYVIVVGEIALLPLAFHAWIVAIVFSALNLGLLTWRIRVEDACLDERRQITDAV